MKLKVNRGDDTVIRLRDVERYKAVKIQSAWYVVKEREYSDTHLIALPDLEGHYFANSTPVEDIGEVTFTID